PWHAANLIEVLAEPARGLCCQVGKLPQIKGWARHQHIVGDAKLVAMGALVQMLRHNASLSSIAKQSLSATTQAASSSTPLTPFTMTVTPGHSRPSPTASPHATISA